ncbi:galactose-binding domain-like protein [Geopyxis carbonaria]|nr:galactose-binding domain-like protein [Geopyxis carbonaria]
MATPIDPTRIASELPHTVDLLSAALGGTILSVSDEFFAAASNLLTPTPPIQRPGHFVATGAWYDGWETRRHNAAPADWAIAKLGVSAGVLHGFEIDTAFFNGNHAPAVSVEGALLDGGHPTAATPWEPVLPRQPCGPSARHAWRLPAPSATAYSHLRLRMYPDGGIARWRAYGRPVPVWPSDADAIVDLAHVANGGVAVACSDEHFGGMRYLNLPGRGKDMGDGWETRRSREPGHTDWVVLRLGARGTLEEVVVDTMHFRGNFPQAVEVYAVDVGEGGETPDAADERWRLVVERSPCKMDTEHAFTTQTMRGVGAGEVYSHVKMVIIPDGGVKRLRVFGKRVV